MYLFYIHIEPQHLSICLPLRWCTTHPCKPHAVVASSSPMMFHARHRNPIWPVGTDCYPTPCKPYSKPTLKVDGWMMDFFLGGGMAPFSGAFAASFREGIIFSLVDEASKMVLKTQLTFRIFSMIGRSWWWMSWLSRGKNCCKRRFGCIGMTVENGRAEVLKDSKIPQECHIDEMNRYHFD